MATEASICVSGALIPTSSRRILPQCLTTAGESSQRGHFYSLLNLPIAIDYKPEQISRVVGCKVRQVTRNCLVLWFHFYLCPCTYHYHWHSKPANLRAHDTDPKVDSKSRQADEGVSLHEVLTVMCGSQYIVEHQMGKRQGYRTHEQFLVMQLYTRRRLSLARRRF